MSKSDNQILTGTIWKQLLLFFFPILIGTFFQQMYNTIDAVIVGQFAGKEALSSVGGASGQIINLVVGFFTGLTAGGSVLISQFYGAGEREKLQDALHTSYGFGIVGGIVLGIVGVFAAPFILRIMNTPDELLPMASLYVRIYFSGIFFVFIYNMGSSILRALGDSKRPLYYLMICSVVNIVLDLLLVLGLKLGVMGVAIATLISQAVSAVMVTLALMYRTNGLKLYLNKIHMDPKMLRTICGIGLPSGVQSSMYSISNMIIQSSINLLGVDTMAAWVAYGKIDALFWMINSSFGVAAVTFVGQNFGAGNMNRVRKGTRITLWMAMGAAVFMSTVVVVSGRFLMGFFTTDPNVVEIGMTMVHIIAPAYLIFVFIEIFSSSLRAQGYTLITTIISLLGICGFRILYINVFSDGSIRMISYCYPISWLISAVAVTAYYIYKQKRIEQSLSLRSKTVS